MCIYFLINIMRKFTKYFTSCWKKTNKISPKLPEKNKEEIEKAELDAFIDLEMYDIPKSFIQTYGIENVINKLKQQYYWTITDKIDNPNLYIPFFDWHLRFIGLKD